MSARVSTGGGETIDCVTGAVGQCIHTPGHTRGSTCYYFPAFKLLFTGDTLFKYELTRPAQQISAPKTRKKLKRNVNVVVWLWARRANIGRTDLIDGSFRDIERSIRSILYKLPDDTKVGMNDRAHNA